MEVQTQNKRKMKIQKSEKKLTTNQTPKNNIMFRFVKPMQRCGPEDF